MTSYNGRSVLGSDGRALGRVNAVLFHASEPRVVGVQIDPGVLLGVIDRKPSFALLTELALSEDRMSFQLSDTRLPKDGAGERALGFSWDDSVIWLRMPVRSEDGGEVGTVHDVTFDAETGVVTLLRISGGAVGDVAVGRLEVPGELVRGFDGEAVVVLPGYADITAEGGAAKVVASGVAVVKSRGGQVAEGALEVGVAASRALGRSIKGGAIRKAIDKAKSLMDEDG
ncbi:MAG: PRC-barrel domain-containing protein [Coriobacteriia bacterium]|nr:PRC-barrel domain-containing protein [Coriobacteriia bacterium]